MLIMLDKALDGAENHVRQALALMQGDGVLEQAEERYYNAYTDLLDLLNETLETITLMKEIDHDEQGR